MSPLTRSTFSIEDIIAQYIRTGQASIMLKVNRLTVRTWIRSGKLTGYRIGNFTLINRLQVEKIISERQSVQEVYHG